MCWYKKKLWCAVVRKLYKIAKQSKLFTHQNIGQWILWQQEKQQQHLQLAHHFLWILCLVTSVAAFERLVSSIHLHPTNRKQTLQSTTVNLGTHFTWLTLNHQTFIFCPPTGSNPYTIPSSTTVSSLPAVHIFLVLFSLQTVGTHCEESRKRKIKCKIKLTLMALSKI